MASASDPAAPDLDFPADAIEVARVLDAWGVKGWIRVQPYAKDPQALFSSTRWVLRPPEPRAGTGSRTKPVEFPGYLKITHTRSQGDDVLAQVRGIDERNAAEALRGARIFVSRHSFPSTVDDEFYWVDLIGLEVFNREQIRLGQVAGLIDTGVHSVLRVTRGSDADEVLIPFVAAYVDAVDMASRQIRVDWGLDY